jgi:dolichol-phosphate mannosyltransferase
MAPEGAPSAAAIIAEHRLAPRRQPRDLTVVIPALDEGPNLVWLLPELAAALEALRLSFDIVLVSPRPGDLTRQAAAGVGARVIGQKKPGYGGALVAGFFAANSDYVLTMDADLSHRPLFLQTLWNARTMADIVVGSRYVPGGQARMPKSRYMLSRMLNRFFKRGLSLPVRDLSSRFRLYRRAIIRPEILHARDFDILPELLVRAYADGWKIAEVPFEYSPREHGSSHARIVPFGLAYLRTFWSMWKLRNSIVAADYDDRAHDSPIFLQRYWQRRRYRHVADLIAGQGRVLDVGCGSSRIIGGLPAGSIGLDVLHHKLRFARKFERALVCGSGFMLPFPDESFPCVLCSQVIEHVPKESPILDELCRVLAPGGRLVLGTPDYGHWEWIWMERAYGLAAPGGYADEHIAHYTNDELMNIFTTRRFTFEAARYILRGELIMAFRKPLAVTSSARRS